MTMLMTRSGMRGPGLGRVGPMASPPAGPLNALPDRAAPTPPAEAARQGADRVGALLYLYLGALLLPVWFHVGPLYLSVLRLLLIVVIAPVLFKLLRGGYGRVLPTDILFMAHILWAAVALAVNNPGQVIEQVGSVGIEFLGGYAVGRACIRSKAAFLKLCRVLLLSVLALLPFSIYETMTGDRVFLRVIDSVPGLNSFTGYAKGPRLGLERVQSVFSHPIHFGLYCSVILSLVFVGLRGTLGDASRRAGAALVLLSGFLSLSSAAFVAMFMQVFLIGWAGALRSVKARWWILVAAVAICFVAIELLSTRSAIRVFLSYATLSAHTGYWRMIIFEWGVANVIGSEAKGIAGSPLFGIGLNNWIRPSYMYSGSMDNFWLVLAVRYGIPGFALLALGYCWALSRIMRRDVSGDPILASVRLAWVFTFVGLTFTLCTVHVWGSIYSFTFFIFGAGMWLAEAGPGPAQKEAETSAVSGLRDHQGAAKTAFVSLSRRAKRDPSAVRRASDALRASGGSGGG